MKDKKDPICGMKGHIHAHGHYFCSEHCIRAYEKKNKIKAICPECIVGQKKPWYKQRLTIISFAAAVILFVSYLVPLLNPWLDAFVDYAKLIWWAVLLGLLLGGIIDYFIPRDYIEKYLGQHKKRTIGYAVLFGFFMSACSHGILAIAIELYKKGANTSSVIAFLLAAPWANFPLTILFFGMFGWKAIFIIASAIFIAITTGLIYQILEKKGLVESHTNIKDKDGLHVWKDIRKRYRKYKFDFKRDVGGILKGASSLSHMVLWWIVIGMMAASAARAFIPEHFFMTYMGATALGMIVVLVLATIIEVCSEGSAPMAFEIFKQTGAFGNSFIFLMAGVATDYTEIGLIWTNIGRKAALWLPVITVPQILVLGYIFNLLI
jgi:uncharacterized membrane protein YraQ (UPF0718 family)